MEFIPLIISILGFFISVAVIVFKAGKQDGKIEELSNSLNANQAEDRRLREESRISIETLKEAQHTMKLAAATNSEMVKTLFKKVEDQQRKIDQLEEKQSATNSILVKFETTLEHVARDITDIKNLLAKNGKQPAH